MAGEPAQTYRGLAHDPGFREANCVVLRSLATSVSTFYLDNLTFTPERAAPVAPPAAGRG